jgi:homoserine O-acetyltransferase
MDYFDPFAAEGLRAPDTHFQLISFSSDWRFGTEHSVRMKESLLAIGATVEHHDVESPWGHDSFLMDVPEYHRLVSAFVR